MYARYWSITGSLCPQMRKAKKVRDDDDEINLFSIAIISHDKGII